ncbi:uncharacterized protein PEZ65_000321 [Lycodopsis pacificus]
MGQPGEKGEKGHRGWRGLYGDMGTPGMIKGSKGRGCRCERKRRTRWREGEGDACWKGERIDGNDGSGLYQWVRVSLQGERGVAAAPGEKGDPGQWGDAGQRAEQGPRGEPGGRGTPGSKGSRGPAGGLGHLGPAGLSGLTGEPGLPGQVYVLPGLLGDTGNRGPSATCNCSQVQTPERLWDRVQTIFIADGEGQMRRLRGENVMVLRTDRKALFIYSGSQWINVLEDPGR